MLRRLLSAGLASPELWTSLANAGVLGLALPEKHGGSGGSLVNLGAFSVEAGRGLCPMIVHSTIHAGLVVHALGSSSSTPRCCPSSPADDAAPQPLCGHRGTPVSSRPQCAPHPTATPGCSAGQSTSCSTRRAPTTSSSPEGTRSRTGPWCSSSPARRLVARGAAVDDGWSGCRPLALRRRHGRAIRCGCWAPTGQSPRSGCAGITNTATALLSLDLVGVGEAALQRTVDHTVMRHQFGRPSRRSRRAASGGQHAHRPVRSPPGGVGGGVPARRRSHAPRARRPWRACTPPPRPSSSHSMRTNCTAAWATSSTPTCTGISERARVLSTLGGGADIAAKWLEGEMNWEPHDDGRQPRRPGFGR